MSHRNVIAWQKGMDLVESIYQFTSALPDTEKFGLVSQMRRAVISIPSNIAEGYGRGTKQDYARFLDIAMGSLRELQTQLEVCQRLEMGSSTSGLAQTDELARIIRGLANSLRRES